jgi:DNA-binding beta-propeller fold protein YncE
MAALLTLLVALFGQAPTISSPVGTGEAGDTGDGGPAAQARLNQPFDVVLDSAGNLYLSDTGNHRVRRVDAKTGIITTVAGNGQKGFSGDGGPAVAARLDEPYGLVLDAGDNLYVADRLNARVRRIDAKTGVITTVAGDGQKRYSGDGGPAINAGLVEPNGLAFDGRGRLFVADVADHRVRVVYLATGRIATFAGDGQGRHAGDDGPAETASLHGPRAVAVGADGTLYILERQGNSLRAVSPKDGTIRAVAGNGRKGNSGDGGPALDASFDGPKELDIDKQGNILIVDTENHTIRRIDGRSGTIQTVAGSGQAGGSGDGGAASEARLDRPHGVAAGPEGVYFIGDTGNHRIRRVSPP